MAFEEFTDALHTTSEKTQAYINNTAEYQKLRLFKASMKYTSKLIYSVLLGSMAFLSGLFLFIGTALWINTLLESVFLGFVVVGLFLAILCVLAYFFAKKPITSITLQSFSSILNDEEKGNNKPLNHNKNIL